VGHSWSLTQVNSLVLHKQRLDVRAQDGSVVDTVRDVGGLHATGASIPYLSLWARRKGFAREELHQALYEDRRLAKVLCMRNTLFILPKELLPVAYQATRKRRWALLGRYLRHYGITDAEYEGACARVSDLLRSGPKTTTEIKQELSDASMSVMVDLMPDDWRLVRASPRGTWRSNLHQYVAFDDWFPDVQLHSLSPRDAQRDLVRHYLSAFGPAIAQDVAWWAGMSMGEVRQALESLGNSVVESKIEGLEGAFLFTADDLGRLHNGSSAGPALILLPSLDPYVMGYKERSRFLPPDKYDKVFDRSGNALPTVLYDGRVIGVWMEDTKRQALRVLLFDGVEKALADQLEDEGGRLSRFLQHDSPDVRIELYPEDVYARTPFSLGRKG
jgi:hypothetical protein